jgi:putative FmdB family regulatory protein
VPLYEYECATDGRFEVIRKFSDPPLFACPKCGSPVEKQASAPAIQFKGTGWYVTDYARKGSGGGPPKGDKSSPEKAASSKDSSTPPATASSSTPSASSGSGDKG